MGKRRRHAATARLLHGSRTLQALGSVEFTKQEEMNPRGDVPGSHVIIRCRNNSCFFTGKRFHSGKKYVGIFLSSLVGKVTRFHHPCECGKPWSPGKGNLALVCVVLLFGFSCAGLGCAEQSPSQVRPSVSTFEQDHPKRPWGKN